MLPVEHGDELFRHAEDGMLEKVGEVHQRCLCEQDKIMLRPNQFYYFVAMPDCAECMKIANFYKEHE